MPEADTDRPYSFLKAPKQNPTEPDNYMNLSNTDNRQVRQPGSVGLHFPKNCLEPVLFIVSSTTGIIAQQCHGNPRIIKFVAVEIGEPMCQRIVEKEIASLRTLGKNHIQAFTSEIAGCGVCIADCRRHRFSKIVIQQSINRRRFAQSQGGSVVQAVAGSTVCRFALVDPDV